MKRALPRVIGLALVLAAATPAYGQRQIAPIDGECSAIRQQLTRLLSSIEHLSARPDVSCEFVLIRQTNESSQAVQANITVRVPSWTVTLPDGSRKTFSSTSASGSRNATWAAPDGEKFKSMQVFRFSDVNATINYRGLNYQTSDSQDDIVGWVNQAPPEFHDSRFLVTHNEREIPQFLALYPPHETGDVSVTIPLSAVAQRGNVFVSIRGGIQDFHRRDFTNEVVRIRGAFTAAQGQRATQSGVAAGAATTGAAAGGGAAAGAGRTPESGGSAGEQSATSGESAEARQGAPAGAQRPQMTPLEAGERARAELEAERRAQSEMAEAAAPGALALFEGAAAAIGFAARGFSGLEIGGQMTSTSTFGTGGLDASYLFWGLPGGISGLAVRVNVGTAPYGDGFSSFFQRYGIRRSLPGDDYTLGLGTSLLFPLRFETPTAIELGYMRRFSTWAEGLGTPNFAFDDNIDDSKRDASFRSEAVSIGVRRAVWGPLFAVVSFDWVGSRVKYTDVDYDQYLPGPEETHWAHPTNTPDVNRSGAGYTVRFIWNISRDREARTRR